MTIRRKLALISAAAVLLTSLAATAVVYITVRKVQIGQVDRQLILRLQESDPRSVTREIQRSAGTTSFLLDRTPMYLFDAFVQGTHFPDTGVTTAVPLRAPQTRAAIEVRTVDLDSPLAHHIRVAQVQQPSGIVLRVMRSIDDVNGTVRDIGIRVLLIGFGFALFAAAAIAWLVGRGLQPLQRLAAQAAEAGRSGDFEPLVNEQSRAGADEVAELARSLGFMATDVLQSRERQRRLVDDAAHELRTPLTSLRTNLQLLQQSQEQGRQLDQQLMADALEDSLAESSELASLTEELVALAATGGQHGSSWHREVVDVGQLASDVVFRAQRRSGREIHLTIADGVLDVLAIRARLERAVANLIGNATKFAPEGEIRVRVLTDGINVDVVVEDAGPGIAPEERQLVTQRFWRSPATRGMPGSGLGLAIVADVAQECGGRIEVGHSGELGGARFVLSLPVRDENVSDVSIAEGEATSNQSPSFRGKPSAVELPPKTDS